MGVHKLGQVDFGFNLDLVGGRKAIVWSRSVVQRW